MTNLVKKMFSKEDLAAIAAKIGDVEKTTAGEIRVSIRHRRRWTEKKTALEQMARNEFQKLGMMETKDRTGILIFLLMQDRKFFILADEGIHSKVAEGVWNKISGEMSSHFTQHNFRQGILHGIQEVGKVLASFFPRKSDDTNELPNDVKIR